MYEKKREVDMKKFVVVILLLTVAVMATPAFAGGSAKSAQGKEETLFQMMHDSIEKAGPTSSKKGPSEVNNFRSLQKQINNWDESAARAKALSLRGNK